MRTPVPLQTRTAKSQPSRNSTHTGLLLQRKCACGSPTASLTGECAECKSKKRIQTKLTIGASNDPLEAEADRVADQVLAAPAHSAVSSSPPRIQRFTGHSTGDAVAAPASVDRVLSSSGRPLEPALRSDMEQRFGHDFSRVRIHSDAAAERSAREVNANAYTIGHDIVFGASRFAPGTHDGQRLIAHELTHVVQSGKESSLINRQTIYRQPDHAQIEAEIQMLRMQLLAPVNPLRPVQEARLIQLEAMLNRTGGGASQPSPPKPKPYLDMPFTFRFSKAWDQAKETAQQKVYKGDKAYHDSSITRGLMEVKDLAPSANDIWKTGIYGGLFKNDEKSLVEEHTGKRASQSYSKRYKAAKYGHVYGDERYYESSVKRRDDDSEIWSRGREYGLFLPGEKAAVLNISAIGIARAAALNTLANTTDPKSPGAAKLMDEIHNFTEDRAVVLLGPEIEKLFGQYGFKYRDEADWLSAADAINKAYEKSLQPDQILKDPNASVAERWDECLRKRGLGKNNLEMSNYNPDCFRSHAEYDIELSRRQKIYAEEKRKCKSDHGIKLPSLSRKQPEWVTCENRLDADYFPSGYARRDYQLRLAYSQLQKIDDVINSGAFATLGRLAGYTAAKIAGRDDDAALEWSEKTATIGRLGDFALGVKAGMTARTSSQSYKGGGGLVVSRDAPITQTFTRPSAADTVKDDPWAGSVPRPVDVTGGKAYPPGPAPPVAAQPTPSVASYPLVTPTAPAPKPTVTAPPRAPVVTPTVAYRPPALPSVVPTGRRIVVTIPAKPKPASVAGPKDLKAVRQGPLSPAEERILVLANKDVYVGVQAKVKVEGKPVTEGLGGAAFGELDATRGQALGGTGRAAVLPEVSQPAGTPAKKGSQPSSGFVVEPAKGSTELEVLAWNTGAPQKGANVSHAERQVIDWFRSRDAKWIKRVKSVDIEVFGREICTKCDSDLKALQTAYPHIKFKFVRRDTGRLLKPPPAPRRNPT